MFASIGSRPRRSALTTLRSKGPPVIRGSRLYLPGSGSNFNIPFPAGTQAGDFVVGWANSGFSYNSISSGWYVPDNEAGSNVNGITFQKVVTAADVATGSLNLTTTSSFNIVCGTIAFVGSTVGVYGQLTFIRSSSGVGSEVIGAPWLGLAGGVSVYFISNRANSNNNLSQGILLQQGTDGTMSGAIVVAPQTNSGVVPPATATFSTPGSGFYISGVHVSGGA